MKNFEKQSPSFLGIKKADKDWLFEDLNSEIDETGRSPCKEEYDCVEYEVCDDTRSGTRRVA